jgi:acetyl esterase
MPVDPAIAPLLAAASAAPRATDIEAIRDGLRRTAALVGPNPPIPMHSVTDRTVPGRAGEIPVRVYRPADGPAPTVVFFHGGGWSAGDLESHDFFVRKLAAETGYVFAAVHYRLVPEDPFPAGLDDSTDAAVYASEHAEEFGGIPGRLALAGDSAGGNLAAVVARRLRDHGTPVAAQLLMWPVLDPVGDYPSRAENSDGYMLTAEEVAELAKAYVGGNLGLLASPDVAPARASDLSGLAPAVIGAAEYDPLRDEAIDYGQALKKAGVDAFATVHDGMIHTYGAMFNISPAANSALLELLRQFRQRVDAA